MDVQRFLGNLERRGFEVCFCRPEEVKEKIESLLEPGQTIGTGGSATLRELGLLEGLTADGYPVNNSAVNGKDYETTCRENRSAPYFLTSTNAVTEEGEFVNIDGRGNRIANMIYGIPTVVIVFGTNKIVKDIPAALARIKEVACPLNAKRLGRKTPCAYGPCTDCRNLEEKMCKATLILSHPCSATRVIAVVIDGSFGY